MLGVGITAPTNQKPSFLFVRMSVCVIGEGYFEKREIKRKRELCGHHCWFFLISKC